MPKLFPTKIDLPADIRIRSIVLLNERLADSIDLQTQIKQAHWNVKGPDFIGLHKLFDEINGAVEDYVDSLAERIAQLGGVAEGTAAAVVAATSLPAYPLDISAGPDHLDRLSTALAAYVKNVRAAIDVSIKAGDQVTGNLFINVAEGSDKWLWFLEAHLQSMK